jgi:wyosine [tRNA(Phe)-imidazoG37] synthetase (radical SAM superfamily)
MIDKRNIENTNPEIIFGPVPSRRLGRSMGINNIPLKTCSYSCIYCQIGNTNILSTKRKEFYEPERIYNEVSEKVICLRNINEKIDYITFVADGEPTLDINIGKSIEILKPIGVNIAVITNSSLLWDKDVRNDLMKADLVSVKIDTGIPEIWHKLNRPHGYLKLETIIDGIKEFADVFKGKLITETMLVKDINDSVVELTQTAKIIKRINPEISYILVPTRPPAESFAGVPEEGDINVAFQIFNEELGKVELAISNEGTDFSFLLNSEKELLGILAVHPMRYDAVEEFLKKSNMGWNVINKLVNQGILTKIKYKNNYFVMKRTKNLL